MATTHHNVDDSHGDAHMQGASVLTYAVIFISLIVLLFASVAVAYIPIQTDSARDMLTTIGFTIAGIKALLIILFFMHVKFGSRLTMMFAFGSFFFLIIMFGLTMNDYVTRTPVVKSEQLIAYPAEPSGEAQGYRGPGMNYKAPSDPSPGVR